MQDTLTQHFFWWQGWLNVAPLLALGPVAYLFARLAGGSMARAARQPDDVHWTERARRAFAVRQTRLGVTIYAVFSGAVFGAGLSGPLATLSFRSLVFVGALVAGVGAFAGGTASVRSVAPEGSRRGWLGLLLLTSLFRRAFLLGVLGMIFVPARLAPIEVALWLGLLIFLSLVPISFRSLRSLGFLHEAPVRLLVAVERATKATGVPVRGAYLVPSMAQANAVAILGPARSIWVTGGMLEAVNDRELEAIIAHELGHFRESSSVVAFRTATPLVWLALAFIPYVVEVHGNYVAGALAIGVFLTRIRFNRVSRGLEHAADAHAVAHDREGYTKGLEALHRYNGTPAVLGKGSSHPNLYDRLLAAGVTPDYPRPAPPEADRSVRWSIAMSVVLGVLAVGYYEAVQTHLTSTHGDLERFPRVAALTGGSIDNLEHLVDHERRPLPHLWYVEALARQSPEGWRAHEAAIANAVLGRCPEASAWLMEGRGRGAAHNEEEATEVVENCDPAARVGLRS